MDILKKSLSISRRFVYLIAPILACALFLLMCSLHNVYPMGENSLAWCDANQQQIPLLIDFKDILEGKKGFFMNLANASGMNFYGVFFFFLSNPFSLLVIFVEKAKMMQFFNILMMLKLMTIAFTSSWYLSRKYKNLNGAIILGLSMLYTFSAYNMMYYQNLMWLDMVYLFPLLLASFDILLEKKNYIPYMICIAFSMALNYYIGAMVVFFTILYMGFSFFFKRKEEDIKKVAFLFVKGSLLAALLSAFIYIPAFIQFTLSARSISFIDSIKSSWVLPSYQTTIPIFLCLVSIIPFMFMKNSSNRVRLILFVLTVIPCVIEPINKMWHFGSYQCFPCRYAFMTLFMGIEIVASNLDLYFAEYKEKKNAIIGNILAISIAIFAIFFQVKFVDEKIDSLDQYASTLWADSTSFEAILRYYFIIILLVSIVFAILRIKRIQKVGFSLSFLTLLLVDASFSMRIYAIPPSRDTNNFQEYFELSNKIEDDNFYRVKTTNKIADVNLIGALGYNSIGHYTSLTEEDYMFTMKKLGYSSYWMEVGTHGGTKFTDALLVNKYTIGSGVASDAYLTTDHFSIYQNKVLPFGIATSSDLKNEEELKEDTRANMQEHIYQALFGGESLHTVYSYEVEGIEDNSKEDYYHIKPISSRAYLTYNINVTDSQTLYFECFDKYSNNLNEPINGSFNIRVNGSYKAFNYPSQNNNGVVDLGTYENQTVKVEVQVLKEVNCRSLSVYGINNKVFDKMINDTKGANLLAKGDKIYGSYDNDDGAKYLFVSLPYSKGYKAKINGKRANLIRTFSGFMAIELKEGVNDIKITYFAKGMTTGIILSLLGGVLLTLDCLMKYRFKKNIPHEDVIEKISLIAVIVIAAILLFMLYVFPILINVAKEIALIE